MAATPPREPDHKLLEARQHLAIVDRPAMRIAVQAVAHIVVLTAARTAGLSGQPTPLRASPLRPRVLTPPRALPQRRVPAATDPRVAAAIPALQAGIRVPLAAIPEVVGADTIAERQKCTTASEPLGSASGRGFRTASVRSRETIGEGTDSLTVAVRLRYRTASVSDRCF
jgi:hypothetical protein